MDAIAFIAVLAAFAFFAGRRIPRYLHIFQQDDYDPRRFLMWFLRTGAFDKRLSLTLLLLTLAGLFFPGGLPPRLAALAVALVLVLFAAMEPDPRKAAKKKFVMTDRARRIFGACIGLCVAGGALAAWKEAMIDWVVAVQAVPFLLVLANALLIPVESRIQKRYWDEAQARLREIRPTVVGITGSFGKTSVKHILGHVLEMHARTFFTPGSVNTPMGIARAVRENLPRDCRYFLVEMGAYGKGSIERLCRLTPPDFGIITAIGEAHYERYKNLDTVARTKFEMAEAVLRNASGERGAAGRIIVHENVFEQDYARAFAARHPAAFVVCGQSQNARLKIEQVEQTRAGIAVQIRWQDQPFRLEAPLFGRHHADNVAVAFAAAMALGLEPERVVAALRTVPQITHRLEVKPQADGTVTIDDAFNSNPRGFASALELMTLLAGENEGGGRRILITPGIVELGARNDEVHRKLGEQAAEHADVALVVRADRIPAFAAGFRARARKGELREVMNLQEAQDWLGKNARPKDVILFENDLPDVLERRLKL